MANKVFNEAAFEVLKNGLLSADLRISWHMGATTIDTEDDGIATNGDFTTPDEFDGLDYTAGGFVLDGEAITTNDAADRAELDADDEAAGAQRAGSDSVSGILLYSFVTSWVLSTPIAWLDTGTNLPFAPDGGTVDVAWAASGLLHLVGLKV